MKKFCIGIDISKKTFDATAIFVRDIESMENLGYEQFSNTPAGFRKLAAWTKKLGKQRKERIDDALFCMETTGGYDRQLCSYLYDHGLHVWRESALQIHRSLGFRRGKSDKADSLCIAEYAGKNQSKCQEYKPSPESVAELKELVNYRNSLVERRKQCKTRMSEKDYTTADKKSSTYKFMCKSAKKEKDILDKLIKECEKQIEKVIKSDEQMSRHYQHITSIKGIGLVNAAAIIAFSEDFQKIRTANKMFCYAGGAVFYLDSGISIHKRDPNKNVCCKMLGTYLRMAAKSAIKNNPDIKQYSDCLQAKGKRYGIVIKNVTSKLLHIIYSLIKNDCDYEQGHESKRIKERAAKPNVA